MENWLGQDINDGDFVYRGARDGNTSSYKVGVIKSINVDKGTARVNWQFAPGHMWQRNRFNDEVLVAFVERIDSNGSPTIETLVKVDQDVVDYLNVNAKQL